MAYEHLTPATLTFSESGIPFSADYGDIYHSADGGPGQARHVFLRGNRLPERWQGRDRFVILETGFGTGLNFLATWQTWRDDPQACRRLHYLAIEKHPFQAGDLATIHAAWPEFAELATELRAHWPILTPGFHRIEFAEGRLILTLLLGEAAQMLDKLQARVDAFYLDGFAPGKNPDLWSPKVLRQIGRRASRDATVSTWSTAATVKTGLKDAGFNLTKAPGFASKREMLVGGFNQRWTSSENHSSRRSRESGNPEKSKNWIPASAGMMDSSKTPVERKAIVIGAGIAGCTCCERLASRGWDITLIDRREGPGMEASGNLAGILMPMISRDDNLASRLTRSALLYALRYWQRPAAVAAGAQLSLSGAFQVARNPEQEQLQRILIDRLGFPAEFMTYLDREQAGAYLGHAVHSGGWLFRQAGWANPPSLCQASLKLAGQSVHTLFGCTVSALKNSEGRWQALDASGRTLAEAPVVVLANGCDAVKLEQAAPLPIQPIRGQVTLIPEGRIPRLRVALCGEGYVAPALAGLHAVGASYDLDADPNPRPESTQDNLDRLANLLPAVALEPASLTNRVGFRPVARDRLPIMGAIPDRPATAPGLSLDNLPRQIGLHSLLGYASRGLTWAPLLAEALACQLEGEPAPLETDLLAAIDPARFALRAMRRDQRSK
jgi:tRNA 5-methylaminomethyl-2-thiouridine biosynthesis bifunctional protein